MTTDNLQCADLDGVKVYYTRQGEGSPVIMMHGWGCDNRHLSALAKVAAENHCVYNLDLPGFGASPEPPAAWGVEEYTQMLERFVKHLGIKNPVLLGHSFGGRIAILYASRNPVAGVVLVDAAGVKPRRSLRYYFKVYSFKLGKKLYPLFVGKEKANSRIEQMRAKGGSADYNNASPLMRQVLVKAVNTDLRSVMPKVTAPVQLIWGEEDTATPMRDAKIMNKLMPDSRLDSFPGAGHFSFIDNPFQVASILRRFLKNK